MKGERVNPKLMKELIKALGVKQRRVQQLIQERMRFHGYLFSRIVIALDMAAELGINIRKYATTEELNELMKLHSSTSAEALLAPQETRPITTTKVVTVRLDKGVKIRCSNLPRSIIDDAQKMAAVYPYFYLFENSIRFFIKDILELKYGEDWWTKRVSETIRNKAIDREIKDGKNRWHGKRGKHPIFYIDIDDLRRIIQQNREDFKDYLPGVKNPVEWLTQRIEEITFSRNIIAHHNPLSDNDINRIKVFFKDWVKHLGSLSSYPISN